MNTPSLSHDSSLFGPTNAYRHNGDHELLESLGLRTWNFGREWTNLGTVIVREAETANEYHCATGPRPATSVRVEVSAIPAQFWRFTITRPRDETVDDASVEYGFRSVYEPVEVFEITTGSGGFGGYWDIARAVAEHMVDIKAVSS